jgi:hypothetical protein
VRTTSVVGVFELACALLGLLTLGRLWMRVWADLVGVIVIALYLRLPQLVTPRASRTPRGA